MNIAAPKSAIDPQEQAVEEAVMRHVFEGEPLDSEIARRVQERGRRITEEIRRRTKKYVLDASKVSSSRNCKREVVRGATAMTWAQRDSRTIIHLFEPCRGLLSKEKRSSSICYLSIYFECRNAIYG
jgi:predicted regulator of amino acid metabolism with ACT domain